MLGAEDAGVVEVVEGSADAGTPPSVPPDYELPPRPPADLDPGTDATEEWLRTDILASGSLGMLEAACGGCHAGGNAEGGLGDILNVDVMIATGMIVPGAPEGSPLLSRILDGSMPPGDSRPVPTAGEIALLETFIDRMLWEDQVGCDRLPLVTDDAAYAALLADLASRPAEDRPYLRYLSLTYASNAGACGSALAREQKALFKSINSVSRAPSISLPVPLDAAGLLYRVDLRAYAFDRAIDLEDDGVVDFADAWRAIEAAVTPYSVRLTGPEADDAQQQTGTTVPLLPVNAFVNAVNQGDLYYALVGARRSVFDTQVELGMDFVALTDDLEVRRAAFTVRREPSFYYVASRWEQGLSTAGYYWSLEAEDPARAETVFGDPLEGYAGTGQVIYQLPNGLQAYAVTDGSGNRLAQTTTACVDTCDRPETLNAAACHSCHVDGLVPMRDEVRAIAEQYPANFDAETLADLRVVYPLQPDLDALIAADSALHQAAAEQAGVPRGQPDPISPVFFQFERSPLRIDAVAGELGVTTEVLRGSLPRLPELGALAVRGGSVERAQLSSVWISARCELTANARNRPATCP